MTKKYVSLAEGEMVAAKVVAMLSPFCEQIMVCGSIRRRRPFVGDVDIVAIPKQSSAALPVLPQFLSELVGRPVNVSCQFEVDGLSVDVSLTRPEVWGAAILHATGSKENNVRMRVVAKTTRGMKLSQNGLVFAVTGRCMAGSSEAGIYAMLGLPYQEPEAR